MYCCKTFLWQRSFWLSRNDPVSPTSLQGMADTNSGGQESLPCSSILSYIQKSSWGFLSLSFCPSLCCNVWWSFISSDLVVAGLGAAAPLPSATNQHSPLRPWSSLHHLPRGVIPTLQHYFRLMCKLGLVQLQGQVHSTVLCKPWDLKFEIYVSGMEASLSPTRRCITVWKGFETLF